MRNIIAKAGLFCLLLLIFSCATKTEHLTVSGDTAHPSLKAKVNGKLVNCEMTSAALYNESPKVMMIIGNKGTEIFSLDINDFKGIGTYNLSDGSASASYTVNLQGNLSTYTSTQGTIKITTSTDKKIVGTFEFKGVNADDQSERTISEGSFSLNVTTYGTDPGTNPNPGTNPDPGTNPNPGTSTNMNAKINGTLLDLDGNGSLIKSSLVGDMMMIRGTNGTKSIALNILNYRGNGTYNITISTSSAIYTEDFSPDAVFTAKSGKVTITSSTATTIKGTFEFTGTSSANASRSITEGKFDVSFDTTTM